MTRGLILTLAVASVLLLMLGGAAWADTITIDHSDSGAYSSLGFHDPSNESYGAGELRSSTLRNFFVFDLSSVTETITSATLRLEAWRIDASGTFVLSDVATSVSSLISGGTGLTGIFADLGTGASYASIALSDADEGGVVEITLNAAAITALNDASGFFALGGRYDTAQPALAFKKDAKGPSPTRELVLTTSAAPVPEPASLLLVGGAVATLGLLRQRRRRRA